MIVLPTLFFGALTTTDHKFQVFGNNENVVLVCKEEDVRK